MYLLICGDSQQFFLAPTDTTIGTKFCLKLLVNKLLTNRLTIYENFSTCLQFVSLLLKSLVCSE